MIRRYLRVSASLFSAFLLQSFGLGKSNSVNHYQASMLDYEVEVTLDGEDFETIANEVYSRFNFEQECLNKSVFVKALKGYFFLKQTNELVNDGLLTIIDFSLSSTKKRLWVLDLVNKKIVQNELVAHGKNSGSEYATSFSNKPESLQSSIGFYLTGDPYNGKHKYSLKLLGLEAGYNTNAFARGIVMHGANYVNQSLVDAGQRIGRSFGCPAVNEKVNQEIVDLIKGGSCLFIHANDKRYNQRSKILNNSVYIPLEMLKKLRD